MHAVFCTFRDKRVHIRWMVAEEEPNIDLVITVRIIEHGAAQLNVLPLLRGNISRFKIRLVHGAESQSADPNDEKNEKQKYDYEGKSDRSVTHGD